MEDGLIVICRHCRRTKKHSNLVGGHQRLKALDAMHGSLAYRLTVAEVDLSESEEIEGNLLLNNAEAQGEFTLDGLSALLKTPEIRLEATGFDAADVVKLLGEDTPDPVLDEMTERVNAARDAEKEVEGRTPDADSIEYYLVVVFPDKKACDEAIALLNVEDNRFCERARSGRASTRRAGCARRC